MVYINSFNFRYSSCRLSRWPSVLLSFFSIVNQDDMSVLKDSEIYRVGNFVRL